jgi:hypothetical protein
MHFERGHQGNRQGLEQMNEFLGKLTPVTNELESISRSVDKLDHMPTQ